MCIKHFAPPNGIFPRDGIEMAKIFYCKCTHA